MTAPTPTWHDALRQAAERLLADLDVQGLIVPGPVEERVAALRTALASPSPPSALAEALEARANEEAALAISTDDRVQAAVHAGASNALRDAARMAREAGARESVSPNRLWRAADLAQSLLDDLGYLGSPRNERVTQEDGETVARELTEALADPLWTVRDVTPPALASPAEPQAPSPPSALAEALEAKAAEREEEAEMADATGIFGGAAARAEADIWRDAARMAREAGAQGGECDGSGYRPCNCGAQYGCPKCRCCGGCRRCYDPKPSGRVHGHPCDHDAGVCEDAQPDCGRCAANVCEHGDHEAPEGKRFCSPECERCEHESTSDDGCDGLCEGRPRQSRAAQPQAGEREAGAMDLIGEVRTWLMEASDALDRGQDMSVRLRLVNARNVLAAVAAMIARPEAPSPQAQGWTAERPSEPGLWWHVLPTGERRLSRVRRGFADVLIVDGVGIEEGVAYPVARLDDIGGLWSGPLTPPPVPPGEEMTR